MQVMRNETRAAFEQFRADMAQINGAPAGSESFAVEPSVQQTLVDTVQDSSAFLQQINMVLVDELKGEKLLLGVDGPIASRTNTDVQDRQTRDPATLDNDGFELFATEFNTHATYKRLDTWAKFPDFQNRVRALSINQQRLDRIRAGWHGKTAAVQTDIAANPNLEDLNIGWLEKYRTIAPAQVKEGGNQIGGTGADFNNIDAMVFAVFHAYIQQKYRDGTEFVVICGENILLDKYFPLINNHNQPTEKIAADMIISQKRMGNLQAVLVPFFPADSMLITPLSNLSIYIQDGSHRMTILDNPRRNRIETYESDNEGYVVEDYERGVLIENIDVVDAAGSGSGSGSGTEGG